MEAGEAPSMSLAWFLLRLGGDQEMDMKQSPEERPGCNPQGPSLVAYVHQLAS